MSTTVIDKLIVTLGLDPSDFEKGQKKAAASQMATAGVVKRTSQDMGNDFTAMAKKALTFAAALALVKKLVSGLAAVSTETRKLGIDSQNFGMAANRMRNFQNAIEMAGGKAEDVTRSVEGLSKAVYDLTIMGQSSASLEMLTRLGVQFQDATGHARSFEDVVMDTADALERAQKAGTLNKTEAFFAARQAGLDDTTARLAVEGRASLERELAKQRDRHQVNGEDLAAAEKIERTRTEVDQRATSAAIQANSVGVAMVGDAAKAYDTAVMKTTDAMEGLANAVDRVADTFSAGGLDRIAARSQNMAQRQQKYQGAIDAATKKHGIPAGILSGLLRQESEYDPNARSAAGAVGIAQFMPDTASSRGFTAGKDARRDIDESGKYLAELHRSATAKGFTGQAAWDEALRYYNGGVGRVQRSRSGKGSPLSQETIDYPGKVMSFANQAVASPGAAARAGNTTVNVGRVDVHTAATDASGIARDMGGAIQRKMNVAHADAGQR